jgi:hypothetical protein
MNVVEVSMRWIILLALLISGCVARDNRNTDQTQAATRRIEPLPQAIQSPPPSLEQQLLADDPEHWGTEFARFELFPIPGPVESYAAICDSCYMWWGTLFVFDVTDGRVTNVRCLGQMEHCVYWARCIAIENVEGPLIEAYGMTHMGHGSYYLCRVRADGLETLIQTKAVDFHADLDVIRGGLLTPDYDDVNGDGYRDVRLAGTRDFVLDGDEEEGWTHHELASKCFVYDSAAHTYREDKTRRVGVRYQDS